MNNGFTVSGGQTICNQVTVSPPDKQKPQHNYRHSFIWERPVMLAGFSATTEVRSITKCSKNKIACGTCYAKVNFKILLQQNICSTCTRKSVFGIRYGHRWFGSKISKVISVTNSNRRFEGRRHLFKSVLELETQAAMPCTIHKSLSYQLTFPQTFYYISPVSTNRINVRMSLAID